jgi:hypothetical protein
MGYTHYFPQERDFTVNEWVLILKAFEKILASEVGKLVTWGYDEELVNHDDVPPMADDSEIRFNGIGDDQHENFILWRVVKQPMKFKFCKTARGDCDIVVCMFLIAINDIAPGVLQIGSDGDWHDEQDGWVEARRLYLQIFERPAVCPFAPEEKRHAYFETLYLQ